MAKNTQVDDDILGHWEGFKERYNSLRGKWEAYFDRVPAAIGPHVNLKGEAARSLPQPAKRNGQKHE